MTRRRFVKLLTVAIPAAWLRPRPAGAQDVEYLRALERAQNERPGALTSIARIAPENEPGTPLAVRGRVFAADGITPLAGATVFAYHTDREGLYHRSGAGPHRWRLRGWARTDSSGRFEFHTIRPGAYPARHTPAHIHFTLFTADGSYHAGSLRFDDDPLVTAAERKESARGGGFGRVRPVRVESGIVVVDVGLRVDPAQRF